MLTRTRLLPLALSAVLLVALILVAYIGMFGAKWSQSQEVWGQFGDFFGGVLNPTFALFAFIGVLYNLQLQSQQLEVTREEFRESSKAAQAQIDALREQASRAELVAIVKSLSDSIEIILNETVSKTGTLPQLQLRHVIHEGWRLRTSTTRAGPYEEYVKNARSGGSLIEALHNRLRSAADGLAHFVPISEALVGKDSPVLRYYSHRVVGLGSLLADVGGTTGKTIDFFRQAERESTA